RKSTPPILRVLEWITTGHFRKPSGRAYFLLAIGLPPVGPQPWRVRYAADISQHNVLPELRKSTAQLFWSPIFQPLGLCGCLLRVTIERRHLPQAKQRSSGGSRRAHAGRISQRSH